MKKLIIVLFLISTLANADGERWIAFTEGFWTDHSDKLTEATVKLVNRPIVLHDKRHKQYASSDQFRL